MTTLTEETKAEAEALGLYCYHYPSVRISAYVGIEDLISELVLYKDKPDVNISVCGDDYYGQHEIIVSYRDILSEKEVRKLINARKELNNKIAKEKQRKTLARSEVLSKDIKDLEKKLSRKKKALEKELLHCDK